jgi:serine/threonine protein kinase/tetratricopeptide (TPR) repeat protein
MSSFEDIRARLDGVSPPSSPESAAGNGEDDLGTIARTLLDEQVPWPSVLADRVGASIGPYRLERLLGRGGMGVVYLASRNDNQFQKRVAIKLLNPDADSEHLLRRFQNERQILARLDHPHICRLHDGGLSASGEPYFVMEYLCDAMPIDEYCRHHNLTLRQKLDLFRQACSAVQYAHRFLIVHRDLKPGNVLVTGEGQVKLMDFGIAKNLLTGFHGVETWKTIGSMPMTPAYASPEQIRGEAISTSSDVYSLGVLLFELLTGRRPFDHAKTPLPELLNSICQKEPPRPSTAAMDSPEPAARMQARRLKGDIDWIVLMALRKDPLRRYTSVEQFSDDITRFLEDRPVIARQDTPAYRFRKYLGRNKFYVAAVAGVILALVGGVISTRMEQARTKALFDDVRHLANNVLFEINDAIRDLPGSTPARLLLVKSALTYLDKLNQQAARDSSLETELAEAYRRIGDVQYKVGYANLGDIAGALESARKEVFLRERIGERQHGLQSQLDLAKSYQRASDLLEGTGSAAESDAYLKRAHTLRASLYAAHRNDAQARGAFADSYRSLADREVRSANPQGAIELNRKAREIREQLLRDDPDNNTLRRNLSMDIVRIADTLGSPNQTNVGRFQEARVAYDEALAIREFLLKASPGSVTAARDVCNIKQRQASLLIAMGEHAESLRISHAALAILDRLWVADPANFEIRRDMAVLNLQIGRALYKLKDAAKSEEGYRTAIAIYRELSKKNPLSDRSQEDLAGSLSMYGDFLIAQQRDREALEELAASRRIFDDLMRRNPQVGLYELKRMRVTSSIAGLQFKYQRSVGCAEFRDVLQVVQRLQAAGKLSSSDKDRPEKLRKAVEACS